MEDPETADVILHHISWGFTVPGGHKLKNMAAFAGRIGRLTPEQRGAMLATFEHLRDRHIFDDTDVASLRLAFQLHAPTEPQQST